MGDDGKLLSGNNLLWLIVIGIVIAVIVIFVISHRDDKEPKDVQDTNDRNLLPWVVGVGAVILIVGVAYYYGLFGAKKDAMGDEVESSVMSTRNKSSQDVTRERLATSRSRASRTSASRSPPRGSLSVERGTAGEF
jgi:heme/copper-type cytochrome/quinol oxidase subunit 2